MLFNDVDSERQRHEMNGRLNPEANMVSIKKHKGTEGWGD